MPAIPKPAREGERRLACGNIGNAAALREKHALGSGLNRVRNLPFADGLLPLAQALDEDEQAFFEVRVFFIALKHAGKHEFILVGVDADCPPRSAS